MIDLNKPSWRWFFGLPLQEKKESFNPFEWIDKAIRKCLINGTQIKYKSENETKLKRHHFRSVTKMKSALLSMVNQFAYRGNSLKMPFFYTGGLSALEEAFDVLGWDDPHFVPEIKCQIKGCPKPIEGGSPTKDGYKSMCSEHLHKLSK